MSNKSATYTISLVDYRLCFYLLFTFPYRYVGEVITGTEATQRSDDTYLFDLESQVC